MAPARSRPPQRDTTPWVVSAWKERGLLSPGSNVSSTSELAALHGGTSWFVRRNRNRPGDKPVPAAADGWAARRHRYSRSRTMPRKRTPTMSPQIESWLASIQARLPDTAGEPSGGARSRSPAGGPSEPPDAASPEVFLNLYDLCSCASALTHLAGLGVYHSGIELGSPALEFTFDNHAGGGSGVVAHPPYHTDPERMRSLPWRDRIVLGRSRLSARESLAALRSLAPHWPSTSYDLLEHNCHDWCAQASEALGVFRVALDCMRGAGNMRMHTGVSASPTPAR
jgi:hypothetical protein